MCLGFEPGAAGWWPQMKPQSYGGHHSANVVKQFLKYFCLRPTDLVITWVVVFLLLVLLDTPLIYFWGAFLGYTSGLNLATDLGPVLALFYLAILDLFIVYFRSLQECTRSLFGCEDKWQEGFGWFHSKKWTWTNWSWFNRFTWFINWFSFHGLLCRMKISLHYQLSTMLSWHHFSFFKWDIPDIFCLYLVCSNIDTI